MVIFATFCISPFRQATQGTSEEGKEEDEDKDEDPEELRKKRDMDDWKDGVWRYQLSAHQAIYYSFVLLDSFFSNV